MNINLSPKKISKRAAVGGFQGVDVFLCLGVVCKAYKFLIVLVRVDSEWFLAVTRNSNLMVI
jgi:hypothetical protein